MRGGVRIGQGAQGIDDGEDLVLARRRQVAEGTLEPLEAQLAGAVVAGHDAGLDVNLFDGNIQGVGNAGQDIRVHSLAGQGLDATETARMEPTAAGQLGLVVAALLA